ncbi:hypothetical protein DEO72_LG9g2006 [Vigna unguiculata]|uniref:Uncharacterized protein n=1 Tax=Vigna unguiculata TaxID=3917 RepID=A0A4D6N2B2_VIGUN|nr:hypothetical protein DEO72_LG9g2005 [Vigna unguiculata]QCE06991.1 hypothetical protein DEO72_LG9g2006 [Vigna unguiculata]
MTNKLTTLKKQCVIHKEALEKEREIVKGEKVELEKKYKSWRNYCLESEKKNERFDMNKDVFRGTIMDALMNVDEIVEAQANCKMREK